MLLDLFRAVKTEIAAARTRESARRLDAADDATRSEAESSDANEDDDDDEEEEIVVEEHPRLCRGSLSTSTAALLAMIEPDAARGKVLALSNGSFFREVLVEMTKILAARHGDAALDAVGIVHRLLWMRPDATLAERDSITSALVDIASGHRASSDDDEASNETSHEPNLSDDENMYDPHDLWDWDAERGYVTNDRDDGARFIRFVGTRVEPRRRLPPNPPLRRRK